MPLSEVPLQLSCRPPSAAAADLLLLSEAQIKRANLAQRFVSLNPGTELEKFSLALLGKTQCTYTEFYLISYRNSTKKSTHLSQWIPKVFCSFLS